VKRITVTSILKFVLRWGIVVAGVIWISRQVTWSDRVNRVTDRLDVESVAVLPESDVSGSTFTIVDPASGEPTTVSAEQLVSRPDRDRVFVNASGQSVEVELLGVQLTGDINRSPHVDRLLVREDQTARGRWIAPTDVVGGFHLQTPRPLLEVGLRSMLNEADWRYIAAALLVFPITFMLTTVRWIRLLAALEIPIRFGRALALNMSGFFYSTFLPGSSSGDFIKAFLASRGTSHKTRAVLSVFIDRAIGLITLIIVGGTMAAVQFLRADDRNSPTASACLQVALGSVVISCLTVAGLLVVASGNLRRKLGLSFVLGLLPMQDRIEKVREVGQILRSRIGLLVWALIITVPVHLAVIFSAYFAGRAFDLPISFGFYFVAVPVIVLVGAIPISPQGVGVMEFFAVVLTARQGATVSQALALSMSIRVIQMTWNLVGGLFVLFGGVAAPREVTGRSDEPPIESVTSDEAVPPDASIRATSASTS
jgi:hypothetical protein